MNIWKKRLTWLGIIGAIAFIGGAGAVGSVIVETSDSRWKTTFPRIFLDFFHLFNSFSLFCRLPSRSENRRIVRIVFFRFLVLKKIFQLFLSKKNWFCLPFSLLNHFWSFPAEIHPLQFPESPYSSQTAPPPSFPRISQFFSIFLPNSANFLHSPSCFAFFLSFSPHPTTKIDYFGDFPNFFTFEWSFGL